MSATFLGSVLLAAFLFDPRVAAQPLSEASDKAEAVAREEQGVLQRHYPFYFAYGHELSKLQLSFKSPLMRQLPLYFGYTQLMFWALNENSKPFRDMTFNPELFYKQDVSGWGMLKSVDIGIFNHNSNGRSDVVSRSYNKSYLRGSFVTAASRWIGNFSVQIQKLYGIDENKEIENYVGPLALSVSVIQIFPRWIDKGELSLQASPGGKYAQNWDRGGYQLSLSFRLGGLEVVPAFYLQYYYGFAETLLNYNERVNVFRVGFIF